MPEFLHLAMQGLTLETDRQFELRELTDLLIANFAKLLGADFVPLLPKCVPVVFASLLSMDGINMPAEEEDDEEEEEEEVSIIA